MQHFIYDYNYDTCALEAILNQATDQLGFDWDYDSPQGVPTDRGIQFSIQFTTPAPGNEVIGTIVGAASPRRVVARESVVVRALSYLDEDCGYKIWDIHYYEWLNLLNSGH